MSGREAAHAGARAAYSEEVLRGGQLVTTALVLAEMQVLLLKVSGSAAALRFLDGVAADPSHEVVDVDRDSRFGRRGALAPPVRRPGVQPDGRGEFRGHAAAKASAGARLAPALRDGWVRAGARHGPRVKTRIVARGP